MTIDLIFRAACVWLLIIVAEIIHGMVRMRFLEPLIGDWHARQVAVFSGSAIVLGIAMLTVGWLKPPTAAAALGVGLGWVVVTIAFELLFGRYVAGMSWQRLLADYNLVRGGLLPIGLVVMGLSPWLARWLRAL